MKSTLLQRHIIKIVGPIGVLILILAIFAGQYMHILQPTKSHAAGIHTATPCTSRGVTKNANGTFTFSPLHIDTTGNILDKNGCIVRLLGLNMGGLMYGSADHGNPQALSWFTQNIPMNIVREAYNAYWWDTDVYVPDENMHFRQWLQTVVSWQEQQGNYVILDNSTQFHNPPCGNGVPYPCPAQKQATLNRPLNPQEFANYQPTALQALNDLSQIYAHDPAVIFDVWNEPIPVDLKNMTVQQFFASMNARINAVRKNTSNLVMVFHHAFPGIMRNIYPNYTQPNLLLDTHPYDANWNPNTTMLPFVTYAHNHGQAVIAGEWGGLYGTPHADVFLPFIMSQNMGAVYFDSGFLIVGTANNPIRLNTLGKAVAAGYSAIFAQT